MKESRKIVYRFFELSWVTRYQLVRDLGLIEHGENPQKTADWARCFRRARELEKLGEFRDAIYTEHRKFVDKYHRGQ